jgi:hypothetical protein
MTMAKAGTMIRHDDTTEFLSVADVAAKLGYSDRRPIYRAIDAGQLHAIRLGENGPWKIHRDWWNDFLNHRPQSSLTTEQLEGRRLESLERLGWAQAELYDADEPQSKRRSSASNP